MSKDGGDNVTKAVAILGLFIALLSLYVTWRQDKRIKTTTYSVNALQHRPLLEITGQPILKKCKPTISNHVGTSLEEEDKKGIQLLVKDLEVSLRLKNNGNSSAYIFAIVGCDKSTGKPFLRDQVFDKTDGEIRLHIGTLPGFYSDNQILPSQDKEFELISDIGDVDENGVFVRHYIVLYKNELDMVYDTYYWCRFRLRELDKDENDQIHAFVMPLALDDGNSIEYKIVVIDYLDSNFSTKTYSKEESEEIVSNINKINTEKSG